MPTPSSEERRGLERRSSDAYDPEDRAETADNPTRRKVLSMVTGGIVATAAVGTAAASDRPTVTATAPECEKIVLEYTDHGPTAEVYIDGVQSYGPYFLQPGEPDTVTVAAGNYDITARPEHSRGWASIPVDGSPVEVEECSNGAPVGVTASVTECHDDKGWAVLTYSNPSETSVRIDYESDNGTGGEVTVPPGKDESHSLLFGQHDGWDIVACIDSDSNSSKGDDEMIPINGVPSPIRVEGSDCESITAAVDDPEEG